ncbi:hypothetical protein ZWY2020_032098 [Hordeum vulgare]|nr:hypothetical protein ZWY2020_032098 [Hordeum vulgare]
MILQDIPIVELILVAMWFIWWQKRQVAKGETVMTPEQTTISIRVLATNFVRSNTPKQAIRKNDQRWKNPSRGVIKVNVDASLHEETFRGACGVVTSNDHGKFLGAATQALPHVSSAGSTELLAIRSGLYLEANLGCANIIIESDCMNALEVVSIPEAFIGVDILVVTECSLLAMEYVNISYEFCNRQANTVADGLAKHCVSTSFSEVWEISVPDFVLLDYVNNLAMI